MQYSPKLKAVMEKIKALLNENDIAGIVVLHTPPGDSEYLIRIDPSYSCAKIEGDQMRMRSKLADYGGDRKKQEQQMKDTANMLRILSEVGGMITMNMIDASTMMDKAVGAEHFGGGHTSHEQQNN